MPRSLTADIKLAAAAIALSSLIGAAPALADTSEWAAFDFLVRDTLIHHQNATNHVRIFAKNPHEGDYLAIIPSLARGVEDYTEQYQSTMTSRLVEAGYRVVLVQPRGIGKSGGDLTPENMTMSAFAHDLKASFDGLGITKIHLVGHAFGNRLSRTFATLFPDYVDGLVLLASGGNFKLSEEQRRCLAGSFNLKLSDDDRLEALACAFFAEGNDASVWLGGWYPKLGEAQSFAATMINGDFFKRAGGKPFMVIQAAEDFIAPPDKAGKVLKSELGNQVTYVEVPNAGHALSSEQPDKIADYIVNYLR